MTITLRTLQTDLFEKVKASWQRDPHLQKVIQKSPLRSNISQIPMVVIKKKSSGT